MVYGAIDEKGKKYYTYLSEVFAAIHQEQNNYNWLITDSEIYPDLEEAKKLSTRDLYLGDENENQRILSGNYCFLSGEELTEIIRREDFQWIWAVLSGFDKSIPLEEILKYPLPRSDGYEGFWKTPLSMQHPLAEIEIVPFDSSMTLIFSTQKDIVDRFLDAIPGSRDLARYNQGD